ncbi:MAG: UvrD-helicase domain-containing protein [Endomicrobia bacterium]|nr:UvrD-helicase domain-containing protein [Endomicrobiia bacterium]MCL2800053.1 UvrD-helicase domain-containing protein [Endomicrobiia bacterium]
MIGSVFAFFNKLLNKRYEKEKFIVNLRKADAFRKKIESFDDYITWKQRDEIIVDYSDAGKFFAYKTRYYKKEIKVKKFNEVYKNFKEYIKKYNKDFTEKKKKEFESFFDNVENKKLDGQQRAAIITEEYSNLIVAGAGTGKTLTILGKVKYLIEKKNVNPDKILLLSFTKKTVGELNERLQKLNLPVSAVTFHKLGYDVVKKYSENAPSVADENLLKNVVKDFLKKWILQKKPSLESFIQFIACYMLIPEEDDKFRSLGEKIDTFKGMDYETLKSKCDIESKTGQNAFVVEQVKSAEELAIANFLFLNGIEYEYEKLYPYGDYPYRPDFYFPKYDIWLEHFGISKDGRAKWLSPFNEQKYLEVIQIKRKRHKEFKTKLLETYSHYNKDNILLEKLEIMLKEEGVEFNPVSREEIYNKVVGQDEKFGSELHKLIESFINLSKSKRTSDEELQSLFSAEKNVFIHDRQKLFLDFVLPISQKYDETLAGRNEIDFNDMINLATDLIIKNGLTDKYDYVIIDEYQDISFARFKLISAIRDLSDAKLICVGDDWQSIYRFAGSDVSLFSNFGKFAGEFALLLIERTYRNSQQLIDISAKFIQKNPQQIKKSPVSQKSLECPVEFLKYGQQDECNILLDTISKIIEENGIDKKILVLGRHSFDIDNILKKDSLSKIIEYNENTGNLKIACLENADIKFYTVHKAKGLEADFVIVLNLKNDIYGFPNKMTDDPILSLLLSEKEDFRFAEERRMFYVAMTRTKNKVYLLIPKESESLFINEVMMNSGFLIAKDDDGLGIVHCPWCQTGKLTIRKNKDTEKEFLGCTNYPKCNQAYNNVEILTKPVVCNKCQSGFLVKRTGKYGKFLGCTNYPKCENTVDLKYEK